MRKVFPLNPVLLSNLTSVQRGRVILGAKAAKVEGIHEYPTQFANNNIARRKRLVPQLRTPTRRDQGRTKEEEDIASGD